LRPKVLVINFDPSWDFSSLVRTRALNLYRRSQNIEFWNACWRESRDAGLDAKIWGSWPRSYHGNHDALLADARDEVTQLAKDSRLSLVLIVLVGDPEHLRGATGENREDILQRLQQFSADDPLSETRILRILVVRAWPSAGNDQQWLRRYHNRGSVHCTAYISMVAESRQREELAPSSNFDGLRLLVDLARDGEGWRRLRLGIWPRAVIGSLWLQTDALCDARVASTLCCQRLRQLITHSVETFQDQGALPRSIGADDGGRPWGGELGELEANVDTVIKDIDAAVVKPGEFYGAEFYQPWLDIGIVFYNRRQKQKFDHWILEIAQGFDRKQREVVNQLPRELARTDEEFEKFEQKILEMTRSLSASNLGRPADAIGRIGTLIDRLDRRRREFVDAAEHSRRSAPPPEPGVERGGSGLGRRPPRDTRAEDILPGQGKWKDAIMAACEAFQDLPHRAGTAVLGSLVVAIAPPVAYNLPCLWALARGNSCAYPLSYLEIHSAIVAALMAWWGLALVAALYFAGRRFRACVANVEQSAKVLDKQLRGWYQSCFRYSRECLAASWLGMVRAWLSALRQDVIDSEGFQWHFDHYLNSRPEGDLTEAEYDVVAEFHGIMRRISRSRWLQEILLRCRDDASPGEAVIVFIDEGWELRFESNHYRETVELAARKFVWSNDRANGGQS